MMRLAAAIVRRNSPAMHIFSEGDGLSKIPDVREGHKKISMRNATRDLKELVEKGIFEKKGIHGKGIHYVLGKSARKTPEAP